jgi:hypothetical protein
MEIAKRIDIKRDWGTGRRTGLGSEAQAWKALHDDFKLA